MIFQLPQALWLLAIIPLLLILWAYRQQPYQPWAVPYLPLWLELPKIHQQYPRKKCWSTLLADLLLLSAIILALAGPMSGPTDKPPPMLLLLDNSASMGARVQGISRWAQARAWARSYGPQQCVQLLVLAPRPHAIGFQELDHLQPVRSAGEPWQALQMAVALAAQDEKILVLTDGIDARWPAAIKWARQRVGSRLQVHLLGVNLPNSAIAGAQAYTSSGQIHHLQIHLANYTGKPRVLQGQVTFKRRYAFKLPLAPGHQGTCRLQIQEPQGGTAIIKLTEQDALRSDNQCALYLPSLRKARVCVAAVPPPPHLMTALAVFPQLVDLEKSCVASPAQAARGGSYDLTIFTDHPPSAPLGPGNYLFFATMGPHVPVQRTQSYHHAVGWRVAPQHPLMQGLDFSFLVVRRLWQINLHTSERILAWSNQGPLVIVGEQQQRRYVYVAFRLADSQFSALETFPLFIKNILQWSLPTAARRRCSASEPWPLTESQLQVRLTGDQPCPPPQRYSRYNWRHFLITIALLYALLQTLWRYQKPALGSPTSQNLN